MALCIFSGTFNPIHSAHLRVAEFALKHYGFEKIVFIPAYIPPQKNIDKNLAEHRLKMVKLATKYNPKFEVSDIEYKNKGKSYSYITVKQIIEKYNISDKINFLIGTDAFENINTWYEIDKLKKLVHFIVFPRGVKLTPKENFDFELAPMEFIDISSTKIRQTHNSDIDIIKDYIKENELYL